MNGLKLLAKASFHEQFSRTEAISPGSNRQFAWTMIIAPIVLGGIVFLWRGSFPIWLLAISAVFAALLVVLPSALTPLNRGWYRFGLILGSIVSPVVMGLIFFLVVTPIALIRRVAGKDSLKLKFDPEASSYWEARNPPGPDPASIDQQY